MREMNRQKARARQASSRWCTGLDRLYVPLDKKRLARTKNRRLVPLESDRRDGKHSYAEWGHVIGIVRRFCGRT